MLIQKMQKKINHSNNNILKNKSYTNYNQFYFLNVLTTGEFTLRIISSHKGKFSQ